jgi:hypothetical protein
VKKCARFISAHVERGEKQQTKQQMVEAAGQLTHYFHNGLDYSFIWTHSRGEHL